MKHLKKFVSLVLVLASVLSIALSAGAATIEYKDAKSIDSVTAVSLLTELGIVIGYDNNNFKPAVNVTRAEMAKMIALTLNGGKEVGSAYNEFCTFDDVAADHWARGYIGYCAAFGLIVGRNASSFDPEANVTGYEASKIMLCVLGYDAERNGLVGKGWDARTHSLAIKAKLLSYINEYQPAEKLNRNDSCQMLFNTLCATMVETTVFDTNVEKPSNGTDYTGVEDNKLQLVEEIFPTLKKTSNAPDPFGRPCTTWALAGKELGPYLNTQPVISQDAKTTGKAVRSAIGGVIPKSVVFYEKGVQQGGEATLDELEEKMGSVKSILGMSDPTFWLTAGEADKIPGKTNASLIILAQIIRNTSTDMNMATKNKTSGDPLVRGGSHNEIFYDEVTGRLTVCHSQYYVSKITAVHPEYLETESMSFTDNPLNGKDDKNKTETISVTKATESFADLELPDGRVIDGSWKPIAMDVLEKSLGQSPAVGGYVAYYAGTSNGAPAILGAKLLQYAEGRVESIRSGAGGAGVSNFVVGGETFQKAPAGSTPKVELGKSYRIYYLPLNTTNLTYFLEYPTDNKVYVYDAGRMTTGRNPKPTADLVDTEGLFSVVTTDQDYGPAGDIGDGGLVGYIAQMSTDRAGRTVLTRLDGSERSGRNPVISVTTATAAVNLNSEDLIADTATTFVVSTIDENDNETFTVYYGISEVPTITACEYLAYYKEGTRLDIAFIQNATLDIAASAIKEGVLFKTGNDLSRTGEFGTYFELAAIIGNEPVTLKVSTAIWNQLPNGFSMFNSYKLGEGNIVTQISKINAIKIAVDGFLPVENGNVTINGTAMMAHENVLVYTYSLRNKALAVSSIYDLQKLQYSPYSSYYTRHENHPSKLLACITAIVE